ncbi:gamma-glutamylcyclotransferase [Rhodobacteraceae bacterium B1Z28]|uniref:Gamma-glutamylcyclotransferase n=1 Tax=Ruegeria haliotis TaxID=2747601 RepID=A0ABX2PRY4_9RHOB|nr:gamma-glutamylcyclotransferase family protein [Ruegeria haliotis]NVO56480.1 gamma-glutamylcyclotransferase [Ruegeria haliotis]
MADPYFFGYGSLVNLATHDFPDPRPACLKGWRRAWRHTDLRPVAFLTAIPDPESEIEGMIAHVPKNDWAALDEREWAYDRIPATHSITHPLTHDVDIAVYAVSQGRHNDPSNRHPLLLSYIDVVVQGYLRAFGPEGVDRFFATTDGWDAPILNDRAEPRYPRHQRLKTAETELVDVHLQRVSASIVQTV